MKSRVGAFISTLAAGLSASCCALPVALLTLGFTSLGPFALLMRYQPVTLTFSFLMLAAAFFVVYSASPAPSARDRPDFRRADADVWALVSYAHHDDDDTVAT